MEDILIGYPVRLTTKVILQLILHAYPSWIRQKQKQKQKQKEYHMRNVLV